VTSGASGVKFGIHQEQAGRKGVRRGEEEGLSRGVESYSSENFHHLARLGSSRYVIPMLEQEQRRRVVSIVPVYLDD
jgi:hypothetical protein